LHHIIKIPLFAILFDLFFVVLFVSSLSIVESKLLENFQDLDFEDLEQQQAGYEVKCP
jgi:hypothetical protein